MKKTLILLFVVAAVGTAAVGCVADEYEDSDEAYERDHKGERDHHEEYEGRQRTRGTSPSFRSAPRYALYRTECGDCHMAYPPTLLPDASWRDMMSSLEDHFGDNAELDPETADRVAAFLTRNSAGTGGGEYGERSWRATRGLAPPSRITQTDYFRGKHHEIPRKMVADNPDVGSFSRCESCHRHAEQGDFDEHGVRIPGYGRWDD